MSGWEWFWVLVPIAVLLFAGIFGPNKVRGKKWRGESKPSSMLGPDKPDPPESRRY